MPYKGIVFDFNGVLLFDSEWHEESWIALSERLHGTPLTREEMERSTHGRSSLETFAYILGRPVREDELLELIQQKEQPYRAIALSKGEEFTLSPGAIPFLDFLVERKIPHNIATASEISNLNFFRENLHLDHWFDPTLTIYDDGKIPSKPDPTIYILACEKLGLDPKECIVVEDSRSGLESARRAGVGMIVAIGPKDKHAELSALPGVGQTITTFEDFDRSLFGAI